VIHRKMPQHAEKLCIYACIHVCIDAYVYVYIHRSAQ
jgi:hypothetical protein